MFDVLIHAEYAAFLKSDNGILQYPVYLYLMFIISSPETPTEPKK